MTLDLLEVKPHQTATGAPGAALFASQSPAAVLFDLDGVLVDTAEWHYRAWQQVADEAGLPFSRKHNEAFRGVSRMECVARLVAGVRRRFSSAEQANLAAQKNAIYLNLIARLTPADRAPGARELCATLRSANARLAVVSASRNAYTVINRLEIAEWFDSVIDGNQTTASKPDPEGFLLAARQLGMSPAQCVVIEDAKAGLQAARAARMAAIAIAPQGSPLAALADAAATEVGKLSSNQILALAARRAPTARLS